MALTIGLLGPPAVSHDHVPMPRPRGTKTWALLAVLALTPYPIPRSRLGELLFGGADDPLASLRWTTSQLRRLLGPSVTIMGDPLTMQLPPEADLDVDIIRTATWTEAIAQANLGRPLLEGVTTAAGAAFELWLETERRLIDAASEAVLHEAALASLAAGDLDRAIDLATRLVNLSPYDENAQALLIRCLASAGDREGAAVRVRACTEQFRRDLGVEPTPALAAAAVIVGPPDPTRRLTPASVRAQLDAGQGAVDAGAGELGVHLLRDAVEGARQIGDDGLLAVAGLHLGTALVHVTRGTDEEAIAVLHQTLTLAGALSDRATEASARRELGFVEYLRGRYDRALSWLAEAEALAGDDPSQRAWTGAFAGSSLADLGRHGEALVTLRVAMADAVTSRDNRALAYAAAAVGRSHHLRGEAPEATLALERSLDAVRESGWTTFTPWPEAWLAMVHLERGRLDRAQDLLDHAYALGCEVGDLCWQSLGLVGLGRLAHIRGEGSSAVDLLLQAWQICGRLTDTYRWVEAYALDALTTTSRDLGDDRAAGWADQLARFAARRGMREFMVRAELHRAALGDPAASEVARLLGEGVDNPALALALGLETGSSG